ncbi:hypothetical protein [Flavobacterium sp. UBA6135]|uniref:hypothetical protein n=1 Tax=Flavobacterium sp. UBA6135 TaxID=1946553 RepID=UPI0025C6FCE4|nr:hypothetical protein [Flavobacterium sp. UBA6135]
MKNLFLVVFVLFGISISNAQKFNFKKDKVLLDGKEILKNDWEYIGSNVVYHLYDLETGDEIIMIKTDDNSTKNYSDDDYVRIRFPKSDKELEMKGRMMLKAYLQILHKNKVLNDDGSINEIKLDEFIKNYDENISNRRR